MVAVHCLLVALNVTAGCVAVVALGCVVVSAYVWNTDLSNVILPEENGGGSATDDSQFVGAEVPAYAATLAFSSILFVVSIVGIYGAVRRMRSAIFAFVSLGLIAVGFQLIALAVLLSQTLASSSWSSDMTSIASVALFIATGVELFLIFLVLVLFCVDPHGKSIYEEDLSWCGPDYVTTYIGAASFINAALAGVLFAITLGQFISSILPNIDGPTFGEINGLEISLYVLVAASAINVCCTFLGCCGARKHSFWMLTSFMVTNMVCIGLQVSSALVILIESNKARLTAAEDPSITLDDTQLGQILLIAAIALIFSVFQFGTSFMIGLVMVTDKESVFVADYM